MTPDAVAGSAPNAAHASKAAVTSVLLVDDHAVFRADARALLEAAGYLIVGEAADAAGAITAARELDPDVVLLDVQLPDGDGFSVAKEIAAWAGATQIVLISSREAIDYGHRLAAAPTRGFIHKPDLSRARLEELVGPPA